MYMYNTYVYILLVAASVFYKYQLVTDFLKEIFERDRYFSIDRPLTDQARHKLSKELKGDGFESSMVKETIHVRTNNQYYSPFMFSSRGSTCR